MSDLGFNKIAACVLGTGLALIGLNEASHAFFHEENHAADGYAIAIPEVPANGGPAVVEGPRDYFKLVSAGDVEAGKLVANKCLQCHHFEPNAAPFTGPGLYGVVGRDIGGQAGFKYSAGAGSMSEKEGVWDYAHLDTFLQSPKKVVPATAMNFVGLSKQKDRSDLMAYLRTLTAGEPYPLPDPLPEAPAAPADGAVPADGAAPAPGAPAPAGAAPATPAAQPAPAPH